MAQGDALPSRFPQNIQQQYWVAEDGNDTTGNGTQGAPWATLNKVRLSIVNPGTGDVAVNMAGDLVPATDAQQNLLIPNGATSSTHRWIFRTDPTESVQAIVRTAPGATLQTHRHAIRMDEGFCTFENFEITQSQALGLTSSAAGIWVGSGAGTPAPDTEIFGLHIHDLDVISNTTRFQGIKPEFLGGGICIVENTKIHDIGASGQADLSHGAYTSDNVVWFINCVVYGITKGYGLQFFAGTPPPWKVIHCTIAGNNWTKAPITYVAGDSMQLRNSILWDAVSGTPSVQKSSGSATNSAADHVIIRRSSGTNYFAAGGDFTQTNVITGNLATNPFVDEANNDYRLAVGAEAIGFTNSSWSRPYDILGNPRPAGAEDAGAYQFVSPNPKHYEWRF